MKVVEMEELSDALSKVELDRLLKILAKRAKIEVEEETTKAIGVPIPIKARQRNSLFNVDRSDNVILEEGGTVITIGSPDNVEKTLKLLRERKVSEVKE